MNDNLSQLVSGITNAKSILILLGTHPSPDSIAAALSLSLSLPQLGKSIKVACPSPMTAGLSRLVGIDKVGSQVNNKNLIISFSVPEEAIEKVSYNYENGKLNFIVEPSSGYVAPGENQVSFSYSGIDADLLLLLGVKDPQDLGQFAQIEELANHPNQLSLSLDSTFSVEGTATYSQIAGEVISSLNIELTADAATNLLIGIDSATNNLSKGVTPEALEIAAKCLRAGAVRQTSSLPDLSQTSGEMGIGLPAKTPPFPPRQNQPRFFPRRRGNFPNRGPQTSQPANPSGGPSQFTSSSPVTAPIPSIPSPTPITQTTETDVETPIDPSPDWFEPKIYKGSSLI